MTLISKLVCTHPLPPRLRPGRDRSLKVYGWIITNILRTLLLLPKNKNGDRRR